MTNEKVATHHIIIIKEWKTQTGWRIAENLHQCVESEIDLSKDCGMKRVES